MKTCKRKKSYPSWAMYKAIDKDGSVFVYELEPTIKSSTLDWFMKMPDWIGGAKVTFIKTKKNYKGDWTKSLRRIED